jgi:hypothetical protein
MRRHRLPAPARMALVLLCVLSCVGGKLFQLRPRASALPAREETMSLLSAGLRLGEGGEGGGAGGQRRFKAYGAPVFESLRRRYGFAGESSLSALVTPGNVVSLTNADSKGGQPLWRLRRGGVVFKCVVSLA